MAYSVKEPQSKVRQSMSTLVWFFLSSFKFKHLIGRYFTNMVYTIRMYFPINSTSTNREKMRSIKSHICHLFSEGGEVFFEKKKRCCMALITRVVSGGDFFFFKMGFLVSPSRRRRFSNGGHVVKRWFRGYFWICLFFVWSNAWGSWKELSPGGHGDGGGMMGMMGMTILNLMNMMILSNIMSILHSGPEKMMNAFW